MLRAAKWRLADLAAVQHSPSYLFVYKQHDLHMDHPEEPCAPAQRSNRIGELASCLMSRGPGRDFKFQLTFSAAATTVTVVVAMAMAKDMIVATSKRHNIAN